MNHGHISRSAIEFGTTIRTNSCMTIISSDESELEEVVVIYALVLPAQWV